jgi:hypothetical protein
MVNNINGKDMWGCIRHQVNEYALNITTTIHAIQHRTNIVNSLMTSNTCNKNFFI